MNIQPTQAEMPKKHTAAKVAGAVLATAAAAGTVLYLAKTGKLNAVEGDSVCLAKAKAALKKPADFINSKIEKALSAVKSNEVVAEKLAQAKTFVNEVNANPKFVEAKNVASEKLAQVKTFVNEVNANPKFVEAKSVASEKLTQAKTFVKDTIETVKTSPKFAEAKKVAAEKFNKAADVSIEVANKALSSLDNVKDFVESKLHPEKFL